MRVLELESISFTLKFNSQLPEGSSSYPSICCTYMVYMSVVKYYLPGLDVETLRPVSEALGKFDRKRVSRSYSAGQYGNSTSYSVEEKSVMEAAAMTQIPAFTAMVQYKNYRPMHLGLTPWWTRADAGVLKEDQMRAYQLCGKMQAPTMDNWGVTSDGTVNCR